MIKANELRIGNLTMQGVVSEIDKGSFRVINENNESLKSTWFEIEPIPLTEEWLLKLGFEKTMTWTYTIDLLGSLKLVYYLGEKGWSLGFKNYSDFSNLKYLHELQNLYFALTGKELEMKGGNNE
jgi:hypothetical protein